MSAGAGEQNHSRLARLLDLLDFLGQAPGQSRRECVAAIGTIQGEPVDGTIRLGNQLGHGSLWGTGMLVPSCYPASEFRVLLYEEARVHTSAPRSEERRVGKECRSRWSRDH